VVSRDVQGEGRVDRASRRERSSEGPPWSRMVWRLTQSEILANYHIKTTKDIREALRDAHVEDETICTARARNQEAKRNKRDVEINGATESEACAGMGLTRRRHKGILSECGNVKPVLRAWSRQCDCV
jgi:hypothetical protein